MTVPTKFNRNTSTYLDIELLSASTADLGSITRTVFLLCQFSKRALFFINHLLYHYLLKVSNGSGCNYFCMGAAEQHQMLSFLNDKEVKTVLKSLYNCRSTCMFSSFVKIALYFYKGQFALRVDFPCNKFV